MTTGMGSYRKEIADLLQQFLNEVDGDILEEVKLELAFQINKSAKEVLETSKLIELYELYLQENNNDQKRLALKMIQIIDNRIKDLEPEMKQKMDDLRRRLSDEWPESTYCLYGRESEQPAIMDCLENSPVIVINLWGPSGIGKSHLAKNYIADTRPLPDFDIFYVDLWHVSHVTDLLHKLLIKMGEQGSAKASVSELSEQLVERLGRQTTKCQVLILDDLSQLVVGGQMLELKLLLNKLIEFDDTTDCKLKILVTSPNSSWTSTLMTAEGAVCNVRLDCLTSEASDKFQMTKIPAPYKQRLLDIAGGHPYTLHLFTALAQDCPDFLMSEAEKPDFEPDPKKFREFLLKKSFNNLMPRQKRILKAMTLFSDNATLGAMGKVVDGKKSDTEKFCKDVLAEFKRGIWLRYSWEEIVGQSEITVAPYHSIVKEFLVLQCQRDETKQKDFKQISQAYVDHHMALLVTMGRDYFSNPLQTCHILIKEKSNICQAFKAMADFQDVTPLFNERQDGASRVSRSDVDIAFMFLCLHEFHEHFADEVLDVLRRSSDAVSNDRDKVLVQTLSVLLLTAAGKWKDLEEAVADSAVEKQDICGEKDLSYFCKGLRTYARGALYKQRAEDFSHDLQSALKGAVKQLGSHSTHHEDVKNYFSAHIFWTLPDSMRREAPFKRTPRKASVELEKLRNLTRGRSAEVQQPETRPSKNRRALSHMDGAKKCCDP